MSVKVYDARTGQEIEVSEEAAGAALVEAGFPPEVVQALGFQLPPRAATLQERLTAVLAEIKAVASREQAATGRVSLQTADILAQIGKFNFVALRALLVGQLDPRTEVDCGPNGCSCSSY